MARLVLCAVALGALACAPAATQNRPQSPQPAAPAAGAPQAGTAQQAQGARAASGLKDFKELTKDAVTREGFFDTYQKKDGHVYLAIPEARLGKDFLLTFEIAQGIGARSLFGGTMLNIFEGSLVALERYGDKVYLVQRPHRFRGAPGTPAEKTVELTFGASVLESARIESVRPDSAVLIDIHDWLVSDLSDVGARVRNAVAPRPGAPGRATVDRNRSYVESVKAFPQNVNFRAKLTFTPGEPVDINSVPDSRYIPVSIHYTFAQLPEQPMTPRVADDRMGYFMTVHKDFSQDDETFFVRYVNRWRLEPGTQVGNLWEPKKPIIYYIDRTVPEEYRPYVKQGVEVWNRAFEAAGWKNAIRAEILPDSVDAEDIRYATIRWNASDQPGYGAIGPSMVDPRTGEILDADILFEANFIQGFRNSWRSLVSPAAAVEAMFGTSPEAMTALTSGGEHPMMSAELEAQGTLLRAVLAASGTIGPNDPVPLEFVGQGLIWSTAHEVGHSLGLQHNFRSSTDTPVDKLRDPSWTKEHGVFSSVMEYPSVNLAQLGMPEAQFYNTVVGTSDVWVISYGYTADAERAKAIAREGAKPGHAFASDLDVAGAGAMDPSVNIWDLGSDPLAWAKERTDLIRGLFPRLPENVLADNSRYARLTSAFNTLMGQYVQAVAASVKYIGGQNIYRDHVGDPDARAPFVPVPKAKQLEALAFLKDAAFDEDAFAVPQDVLGQLGANRWTHWGENVTFNGRLDYPLHESILGAQRALLTQITQPFVFARIRDAELKFGSAQVLTIPELMRELTSAVWSEVWTAPRNVSSIRRDLQRAYVDRVSEMLVGNLERLPADARSVARYQLIDLKRRLDARLGAGGSLNTYTRAHLSESSDRIAKVLQASLEAPK
jgi:hypothetical protein